MKATKSWRDWLLPWVFWVLGTTPGWLLGLIVSLGCGMASAVWDPDEVEAYLRSSPWERLFTAMLFGAMLGAIIGVVIGLLRWLVLRRRARDVVLSVLATIGGSALLCATSRTGPSQVESDFAIMLRCGAVGGVIGGGISGLCQWLILRRRVSRADGWILLTVAGWAIGWAITLGATSFSSSVEQHIAEQVFSLAAFPAGGAIAGLGQWLLLRHNVKRAGWWILATAVSWGMAYLLGALFEDFIFMSGSVVGVITGTTLVLLLSRSAT